MSALICYCKFGNSTLNRIFITRPPVNQANQTRGAPSKNHVHRWQALPFIRGRWPIGGRGSNPFSGTINAWGTRRGGPSWPDQLITTPQGSTLGVPSLSNSLCAASRTPFGSGKSVRITGNWGERFPVILLESSPRRRPLIGAGPARSIL